MPHNLLHSLGIVAEQRMAPGSQETVLFSARRLPTHTGQGPQQRFRLFSCEPPSTADTHPARSDPTGDLDHC